MFKSLSLAAQQQEKVKLHSYPDAPTYCMLMLLIHIPIIALFLHYTYFVMKS